MNTALKVFKTIEEVRSWQIEIGKNETIGFVPTMGALHQGHISLLQESKKQNHKTIVSIYVNPSQFNDPKDFLSYPIDPEGDLKILSTEGVDVVFMPDALTMYPDKFRFRVNENSFSNELCGAHRPGHFDGVLTVMLKLLQIIQPDQCFMGEKDYQQFLLVRDMAKNFFLKTEIVGCPTVREVDGLAMSSRNLRLNQTEREIAPALYKNLRASDDIHTIRKNLSELGFEVDYLEEKMGRRFVAARLGNVRLIDNVQI